MKKVFEASTFDDFIGLNSPVAQQSSYMHEAPDVSDAESSSKKKIASKQPNKKAPTKRTTKEVVKQFVKKASEDNAKVGPEKKETDPEYVKQFLIGLGYPEEQVQDIIQGKLKVQTKIPEIIPDTQKLETKPEQPKQTQRPAPTRAPEPRPDIAGELNSYTKANTFELTPEQQEDMERIQRFVTSGVLNKRQLLTLIRELENDD
ncbi:hypothetical protein [Pseudomonas phage vB_Pa-PAC2]|nr:hypothetical protein Deiofobo_0023 [Pseudomonas phage Deifobo]WPK40253.1 hypothetical protein Paride_0023 [Pseudomonas phage Paride]